MNRFIEFYQSKSKALILVILKVFKFDITGHVFDYLHQITEGEENHIMRVFEDDLKILEIHRITKQDEFL